MAYSKVTCRFFTTQRLSAPNPRIFKDQLYFSVIELTQETENNYAFLHQVFQRFRFINIIRSPILPFTFVISHDV